MASRVVPVILLALLGILHAQLWFGRGSISEVSRLQQKLEAQKIHNDEAQQVNDQLSAEVRDLQEGLEMVEERARFELGMVKSNEIFVHITTK
ncbi:cell division protein FtsB [Rhodoferax sp. OV413]|uniref:cell division protein FtsB n=1 Tax=Rhodoferax sp. OV413 TaxID=1855285 RepID=UPI00087E5E73|nr:cell division protein FtsB [Rhodoferax sp. OV413]SDP37513.1 cell division protein FtsB [Rhodoferax sp. OV413]